MNYVEVDSKIVRWVRRRAGLDVESLVGRFPRLEDWESGTALPTFRQLEDFAKATCAPFGYLFLSTPPDEDIPIPHYRTVSGVEPPRPSPNLLDTVYAMQRRQWWMREHLTGEGHDPLPYVACAHPGDHPATTAREMHNVLGLDAGWAAELSSWEAALRTLRQRMDEAGMLVVANGVVGNNTHRPLDVVEFRGFVLMDEYAPLVFVNNADAKAAQMFTLAHELAHVFYGSSASFDLRGLQPATEHTEQACDRAAAEFLVPESDLRPAWNEAANSPDPFKTLARRFKVGVVVAARRALDVQLIEPAAFRKFYEEWQGNEQRKRQTASDGGDFYASQNLRLGKRFASTVIRKARSGEMSYAEAYRLTGLHGRTFEEYARRLGIGEGDGSR